MSLNNLVKISDSELFKFFSKLKLPILYIRLDKRECIRFREKECPFDKLTSRLSTLSKNEEELMIDDPKRLKDTIKGITKIREEIAEILMSMWARLIRRALQFLRYQEDEEKDRTYVWEIGIQKILKYFTQFAKFENFTYGLDEYQREHVLHVFRVFLLGLYLTDDKTSDFTKIKITNESETANQIELLKINNNEKIAMWTIISLTHDLGYPLENLNKINTNVQDMLKYFEISDFTPLKYEINEKSHFLFENLLNMISQKIDSDKFCKYPDEKERNRYLFYLDTTEYTIFSKNLVNFDHGLISSLILVKNLPFFQEVIPPSPSTKAMSTSETKQYLIRREILKSIASHNCDEYSLHRLNSFESLLFICDELQEWNRPYFKDKASIYSKVNVSVSLSLNTENKENTEDDSLYVQYIIDTEPKDLYNTAKHKINIIFYRFRNTANEKPNDKTIKISFLKTELILPNEWNNKISEALKKEWFRIVAKDKPEEFKPPKDEDIGYVYLLLGKKERDKHYKEMLNCLNGYTDKKYEDKTDDPTYILKKMLYHPMILLIKKEKDVTLKRIDISDFFQWEQKG